MRNAATPSVTPSSHSTDPDNTNTMKTQTTSSKSESKNGLASRLNIASWRKHHVATMTADEVAWPQREPSGNLGRIFVLLLLLHVFIIGAVVIYNIMTPKTSGVAKTENTPAVIDKTKAATGSKIATLPRSTTPAAAPLAPLGNKETKQPEIGTYEVRSGDNVPAIVAKLGVSAEELIKQNNLDSTDLYPGRKLQYTKKPAPVAVALSPSQAVSFMAPAANVKPNILKVGDSTLPTGNSPKKSETTVANGDALPKAVLIKAPSADASDTPPAPSVKPKDESGTSVKPRTDSSKTAKVTTNKSTKDNKESTSKRSYVMTSNDTLYSIAKKYGVKVDALQKANNIKDPTMLKKGTRLVIPSKN